MSKRYTRVEVIGHGREYVYWGLVEAHEQDGGRTLKIFRLPDENGTIPEGGAR